MKDGKQTMREWIPVDGAHMTKDEVRIAGGIIDGMRQRGVRVTADSFFDACQKDKEGRRLFNWNRDDVFREACLDRARYILRSVTVRVVRLAGTERKVVASVRRGFVAVEDMIAGRDGAKPEPVTHFVGVEEAMADPAWKKQVLARALAEATNWARRYEELKECGRIVKAIHETRAEVAL